MNTHAYTPMHIQNLINRTAMEANILPLNCYTIIYNDYLQEIFCESQNRYLFCYLDQLLVCTF